jgi:hypothetical protein
LWFCIIFYVIAGTTSTKNSTTKDVPRQWALLTKLKEFWKTKSHTTTSQTFFALMNTSSLKVSCSSNLFEQLKCVIYYHVVLVVKLKKGIISYKTTNWIFTLRKHLETTHWQMWIEWIKRKNMGLKERNGLSKKGLAPPHLPFPFFLVMFPLHQG